jgi:hypothetical protein
LRKAIGTYNAGEMGIEQVERMLLLAYEAADLHATQLHADMRRWQALSHPFRMLRDPA